MPTYEYKCKNPDCRKQLELFESIKSKPRKKCPKCRRQTLQRLISGGAGVIFKGDGFYRSVDYLKDKFADKEGRGSRNGLHTEQRKHRESL